MSCPWEGKSMLTVANDRYAVATSFVLSGATAQDQNQLVLASMPGAGFIAVWVNNAFGNASVVAQRFDLNGRKVGGEFTVGTGSEPAVTALQGGGYLVTWTHEAPFPQSFDIHAQM